MDCWKEERTQRCASWDSVDVFGCFKDTNLQKEYDKYCAEHNWKTSFIVMIMALITLAVIETIVCTWFRSDVETDDQTMNLVYGCLSLLFAATASLTGAILSFTPSIALSYRLFSCFPAIFVFSLNALFMVKLIKHLHLGTNDCMPPRFELSSLLESSLPSDLSSYDRNLLLQLLESLKLPPPCPPNYSVLSLVTYQMIIVLCFCPHLLMGILYAPRLYLIFVCHIPSCALICYSLYKSDFSVYPVIFTFIILFYHLTGLYFQRIESFLDQRKIRKLLEETEKAADDNNAMELRHMIGNVAHDLKTPLTSLTNGLDIIKEIAVSAQQRVLTAEIDGSRKASDIITESLSSLQTCLSNIRNSNAVMLMTINRCIDYTKASKGIKLIPKYENVNLREVLQFSIDCVNNMQDRITITLPSLSTNIFDGTILTDKQWLQENLMCLLSNSVKYSREGNVVISVTLTKPSVKKEEESEIPIFSKQFTTSSNLQKIFPELSDDAGSADLLPSALLFEIRDTGTDLSEEAMKTLFNPFKQAQRLAGGTGLGLYCLAKRIEALNGSYGVQKRVDGVEGSLFWFTIPYKLPYEVCSPLPDSGSSTFADNTVKIFRTFHSTQISSPLFNSRFITSKDTTWSESYAKEKGSKGIEILIVDDAPSVLKMSAMMLRRQGHHVNTAENGEMALKKIEEYWRMSGKGYDLILMDLQMPVMNGLEAIKRIRQIEREGNDESWIRKDHHHMIIGLSANSDAETMNDAFLAGVDEFLGKPFSLAAFNQIIDTFFFSS